MSFKTGEILKADLQKLSIPIDSLRLFNFHDYNFLISDWSGIFIEYALIFKKKPFLINTPKKMVNKNYLKYDNKPIEITLRNIMGKSYNINNISDMVKEIVMAKKNLNKNNKDKDLEKIIVDNFF